MAQLKITLTHSSWYGDRMQELELPDNWKVTISRMQDAPELNESQVQESFDKPIGTKRISELARGKKDAVILVDDLTRPTPAHRVLPYVIRELDKAGMDPENVEIIMALGAHRPMMKDDLEKKLGKEVAAAFCILNHSIYDHVRYLGETKRGTPVYLNESFLNASFKVSIGGVIPHLYAGYGGGAKSVLPGVSGIETIVANHKLPHGGIDRVDGNVLREDLEETAKMGGLDVSVNVTLNGERKVAGVFTGEFVAAHRAAVRHARSIYSTVVPRNQDIAILNAYPLDTEMYQINKSLWAGYESVHKGSIVLFAACSEGRGFHALLQKYGRLWIPPEEGGMAEKLQERTLIIVSPNISYKDVQQNYPEEVVLVRGWQEAMAELKSRHKGDVRVAVFPHSAIQIGVHHP